MTYDEYKDHLKVCEYLGKSPVGKYKERHDFLIKLWDRMEFVVHSRSGLFILQKTGGWNNDCDVFYKDGGWYMSRVGGCMRCNGQKMNRLFSTVEGKLFLTDALNDHLGCSDLIPLVDKRFCPDFIEKGDVAEIGYNVLVKG